MEALQISLISVASFHVIFQVFRHGRVMAPVPLLASGGVGDNDRSGLVTINLNFKDDLQDKVFGSANACSLLVEVLPKFMILMDYLDLQ